MAHIHPSPLKALPAILVLAAGLARAGVLEAQTVTGRVVSADTEQPIPAAFVQVFDEGDERLATALSDAEGRFRAEVPAGAIPVRILVDAFGFERAAAALPAATGALPIELEDILLRPSPLLLDGIRVDVDRPRITPGREFVRRHQLLGKGTFLAGAVITADAPNSLAMYVADRTPLWTTWDARGQPTLYNPRGGITRCMSVMVNRWPLERTGYQSIDEIPLDAIAAIEIHERDRDLPPAYYFDDPKRCGIVQVWLWNGW